MATSKLTAAPYYASWTFPVLLIIAAIWGGWWLSLPVVAALVIIPIIDSVIGIDAYSPSMDEIPELEARRSFRVVLYGYVVLQSVALVLMCESWSTGLWTWWERVFAVISTASVTGGIGITIAHELGHRSSLSERLLGYTLLAEVGYMHFVLEHVVGHHRNVGLPEDPATAVRGESAYRFIVRSAVGQWFHAWSLEANRLRSEGHAQWNIRNRMYGWAIIPMVILLCGIWCWGASIALFLVSQGLVAISLLELVNYIEHYGLTRAEIKPGVRERVRAIHAWESRFMASNTVLFKLQRHADHHMLPQRRYQSLRLHDESPQLPHGYPLMITVALIPPLWRRVIHPRLDALHSS